MICGISSSGQSSQKTSSVSENLTRFLLFSPDGGLVFRRLLRGLHCGTGAECFAGDGSGDSPSGTAAEAASPAELPVIVRLGSDAVAVDADCCCSGIWNEKAGETRPNDGTHSDRAVHEDDYK